MEPIKDLDLLINEGEKIARFAKLFARLPEILQGLSSAQGRVHDADKAVKAASEDLDGLNKKIYTARKTLSTLNANTETVQQKVREAEKEIFAKIDEMKKKADFEMELNRKANNDAVEASIKLMKHEMANHQKAIQASEKAMNDKIAEHNAAIDKWSKVEQEAIAKADKAKKQLAAIIDKING
jgi:chromosome segregation ATPase